MAMIINKEMTLTEWERYLVSQMPHYPQIQSLAEAKFLLGSENRFAIYQIDSASKGRDYEFMGKDFIDRQGLKVEKADYQMVYSGRWNREDSLDGLYERFNVNRPDDFTGHSMSVSDVIAVRENGELKAYFVDSFSFQELPDFIDREQLRLTERVYQLKENRKGYRYLEIHEREEGFDYTFYDSAYRDMDGGVYDNPEVSLDDAVYDIVSDEHVELGELVPDYEDFLEQAESGQLPVKAVEPEEANYNMAGNVIHNMMQKNGPYLEYYAAECDEFHDMGAYYRSENLQEMIEKYRGFLDEPAKLYMGCGLGIIYRDPDDKTLDELEVGIVDRSTIRGNRLDDAVFLAALPMAHEAVEQIRCAFPQLRYCAPKDIRESLYPEQMTTEQLAAALNELVSDFDFYDYQDNFNPEEDIVETLAMELRCGKAHTFMPYLKDIVEEECAESLRAEVLLEKLKSYTPDVPENMEPFVEVKFCEDPELAGAKYQKLGELDQAVSKLDAALSSGINEKTGMPEQTCLMYFTIYYMDDDRIQSMQGKINIGMGNGGIIGHLREQNEARLTNESNLSYQKSKGEASFQAYMADLTDMQEHILPYLQSFCSLTEKAPERENAAPSVAETKEPGAAAQTIVVPTTKGMDAKQEKKSIHERLKINKELIEKQQGKDSPAKGVEAGKSL
jgi:hypothetical protein